MRFWGRDKTESEYELWSTDSEHDAYELAESKGLTVFHVKRQFEHLVSYPLFLVTDNLPVNYRYAYTEVKTYGVKK